MLLAEKVFKTVAEWQVFFDLPEFVLVCDTVVLYVYFTFLPLRPDCAHATAALFVPTTIFLDHYKLPVDIPLEDVIKLDKIRENLIL